MWPTRYLHGIVLGALLLNGIGAEDIPYFLRSFEVVPKHRDLISKLEASTPTQLTKAKQCSWIYPHTHRIDNDNLRSVNSIDAPLTHTRKQLRARR